MCAEGRGTLSGETAACQWCARLDQAPALLLVRQAFAIDVPSGGRPEIVVVPVPHVRYLTALPPGEMAAVLAALSQLTRELRSTTGADVSVDAGEGPHASVTLSVVGDTVSHEALREVVRSLFARSS